MTAKTQQPILPAMPASASQDIQEGQDSGNSIRRAGEAIKRVLNILWRVRFKNLTAKTPF